MLHRAGVKENALPIEAEAVVNFRLLPGDTIDRVVEHVRTTTDDTDVAIRKVGHPREASLVSGNDSSSFVTLHETIRQVFPDAVVAPSLVIGGTDSKHYVAVADSSYRFLPIRLTSEDLKRIHGSDERIAVTDYIESIRFYVQLLRNAAATQQGPE
jgi:carboxypeptidase PM20D1